MEFALQDFRQVALSNQVVTASGSTILTGFGAAELVLVVNVTGSVTGSTPTLTFTVQEVDPGDQVTLIGSTYSGSAITATGTQVIKIPVMTASCVQVSWVIGGTSSPTFNGVYATLVSKVAGTTSIYDNAGNPAYGSAGTPGAAVISVQGVSGGMPVPISGSITATNPSVGTDGSAAPGSSTQVGGTDGSGNLQPVTVKGADPLTTDKGFVVRPVNLTAANLLTTATQGTAAALAGAWPVEITDGSNVLGTVSHPLSVTMSQTDRTASGSITNTQNVAINTQGSASTGVLVTGTWTGTLVFEATVDGSTWNAVNAVVPTTGAEVTSATANGNWEIPSAGYQQVRVRGNTVATGSATVALDSGVGAQIVEMGAPLPTGSNVIGAVTQSGSWTTAVTQTTAANLNATVVQGAGSGSAATYWYVRVTDGTNAMPTMDTAGRAGYQHITDGTNTAAVKAASTPAAAGDPSLVVALSPNSPIPTGSNVIGAVTQSGTWTVQQGTPPWQVAGPGASGSAVTGNPVIIGGSDGVNAHYISVDSSGRLINVGAAASGAAVAGNPVLMGGSDGVDARSLLVDASGRQIVVGGAATGAAPVGNPVAISPVTDNSLLGTFAFGEASRLRVGNESLLWLDTFDGSTVNTVRWAQSTSSMTQAQTAAAFNMNNGAATTANAYSILTSNKYFLLNGEFAVGARIKAKLTAQTNSVIELGFFVAATNVAPTNGVFLRIDSSGNMKLVINFNGTETTSSTLSGLTAGNYYTFVFYVYGTTARLDIFSFDNSLFATTTLQMPATQAALVQVGHLPVAARVYNTATPPGAAADIVLSSVSVHQLDVSTGMSWEEQLSGAARSSNIDPLTGVQTQNFTNSAAPSTIAAASLSNTAAAYSTLGGLFAFNTPASSESDYILFAYQVPANFSLVIWGIQIQTVLLGANSTTTPTVLQWGLAVGSSAVSLATAGSNPPVRMALGMQQAPKSANLGDAMTPGIITFAPKVPLVCFSQKYVHIFVRVPSGNLTSGQINRGIVTIDGMLQ